MSQSKNFERIKYYYKLGLYQVVHLNKLLEVEAITEAEYNEIIKEVNENGA